jgi:flavin reductase (DIM6/NTAB) family NADH-FMN oxidoreductase RutF
MPDTTFKNVSKAFRYRLLGAAPVVVVSALENPGARPSACAVAWCVSLDRAPAKALLVMAAEHATTRAVRASGELVINVLGAERKDAVLGIGSTSSKRVDKWKRFGLTPLPSKKVKAPGIAESLAVLECRILEEGTEIGRRLEADYDLVLVEIIAARADARYFKERWLPEKGAALLHHLGGDLFTPAREVVMAKAL